MEQYEALSGSGYGMKATRVRFHCLRQYCWHEYKPIVLLIQYNN